MLEPPNTELMNQYGVEAIFRFNQVNRERLVKLAQWVDQNNNIKIHINRTFSLDQAGKALDYQRTYIHTESRKTAAATRIRR
jgi:alcohol dehydrogenase